MDNVMMVDLNSESEDGEFNVVFEFVMRGMDELDEGQQNVTQPYLKMFNGEEAEVIRRYLKAECPDLLKTSRE